MGDNRKRYNKNYDGGSLDLKLRERKGIGN
jgi:hypothetical protein